MKSILIGSLVVLMTARCVRAEPPPQQPDQPVNVLEQALGWDTRLVNAMHQVRGERDEDPLRFLAGDVRGIVVDLARYQTDRPVQVKQQQVVGEMDYLIKLLEKQCNSSGSGSSLNPSKPRADSVLANGPGGMNDLHDPKAGAKM